MTTPPPGNFLPTIRNMVGRNFFVKIFFDVWYLVEKGTPTLKKTEKYLRIRTPGKFSPPHPRVTF